MLKGAGAVGLTFTLPKFAAASGTVNFYNWDTYIGETTLDDFTSATGIGVQYDLFADNEELFAKFRNGNPGYDLIVPTNDFVERFIGPDIALWSSHFICKPSGDGQRVPWHEDSAYWGARLSEHEVLTVWLAIDDSTAVTISSRIASSGGFVTWANSCWK